MLIKCSAISILLIAMAFIVFRIIVKNDYAKYSGLSGFSYILEFIVFFLHANTIFFFSKLKWPNIPIDNQNPIIKAISIFFIISGIAILGISVLKLGTKTSFGQDKNKLQSSGIYSYSRNPQLIGYGFMLAGYMVSYFSLYMVMWFLNYIIICAFMIKSEEEFLEHKYKDQYKKYCKSVTRFIKISLY